MKGKLKAFISSKTKELHDERLVLKQKLLSRGIDAFVFELDAGARPETSQQAFLDEVADSDLYIGIFWNQYSAPTIEEFQHARKLGKPCLIYVKDFDVNREPLLEEFIHEISNSITGLTYRPFNNVLQLSTFSSQDIQEWLVRDWRQKSKEQGLSGLRMHYLEKDAIRMLELVQRTNKIQIEKSEGSPPMRYLVKFLIDGIIGIDEDENPIVGNNHIIEIVIHKDYPTSLPFIRFQTSIFHPNIYQEGQVCIGWFKIPYQLDDVCIYLARMIDYQIFNTEAPANIMAAKWANNHKNLFPLKSWKLTEDENNNVVLVEKTYNRFANGFETDFSKIHQNESMRLKNLELDREIEKTLLYSFVRNSGILIEDLKNALITSESIEDFFEKIGEKADPGFERQLQEWLKMDWIPDINDTRKILGLKPY